MWILKETKKLLEPKLCMNNQVCYIGSGEPLVKMCLKRVWTKWEKGLNYRIVVTCIGYMVLSTELEL